MEVIGTEFAEAFLAVQKEMENPPKNHTANVKMKGGGSFSYDYASLEETMECAKKALLSHGITVAQPPVTIDGKIGVRTELTYKSGEVWDRGTLLMTTSDDPQKIGSALTYLRRYGLTSAVGMVAEDDDDGRSAQRTEKTKKKPLATKALTKDKPKGRTVQEHIESIKAHFKLFEDAYGADRASAELINASEYEKKDIKTGEKTGEMASGYATPVEMVAKASEFGLDKAARRIQVICHILEDAYKKTLKNE